MATNTLSSSSSKRSDMRDGSDPVKQWIHPESALRHGVSFRVRYIGSLEVLTSMKQIMLTMPVYADRAAVAKECINRVCEAAGMKTANKKRKVEKRIAEVLGLPNLLHAGEDVNLNVNTIRLEITSLSNGTVICSHDLPEISFASGGDAETIDFIAYVGKNSETATSFPGRWCYVIECGVGVSQDCVSTIGQAFDLRFKQFLKGTSGSNLDSSASELARRGSDQSTCAARARAVVQQASSRPERSHSPAQSVPLAVGKAAMKKPVEKEKEVSEPDYHNDMPGKKPPESECDSDSESAKDLKLGHWLKKSSSTRFLGSPLLANTILVMGHLHSDVFADELPSSSAPGQPAPILPPPTSRQRADPKPLVISNRPASNLIDLHSPLDDKDKPHEIDLESLDPLKNVATENTDPFDVTTANVLLQPSVDTFPWYHGKISRQEAEHLLKQDGDFLVRATSAQIPGAPTNCQQFVLSGVYLGQKHHILLVDMEGLVRARDMTFESVPQLIGIHSESRHPILSGNDAIYLLRPIARTKPL